MKYVTSDLHLGHKRIITETFSGRPWDTIEEHDKAIVDNIMKPLKRGDELFVLGDLSWSKDGYWRFFNSIPKKVTVHWVLGNHDLKPYKQWKHLVTSVCELKHIRIQKNTVALCHYPMITWNKSHYDSWMLYGHHHINGIGIEELDKLTSGKMLNVNIEMHDYKPWSEEEIVEYMSHRPHNWDYIDRKKP